MKNKLVDLNNHLFCQLERLNDDDLGGEDLNDEVKKATSMCKVAETIIANGRLVLDAAKTVEAAGGVIKLPTLLSDGNEA